MKCQKGKLDRGGGHNPSSMGETKRALKMDRLLQINKRPVWKIVSRALGEHSQPDSKKRQLELGRTERNLFPS